MLDPLFLERVADLVGRGTGMAMTGARRKSLALVVSAQMGRQEPGAYLTALAAGSGAWDRLVEGVSVFETYFFREPQQLGALVDGIDLGGAAPSERALRVWSAGCATGEEAYTIAMMLQERGFQNVSVLGTDLSARALDVAREGRYGRWSMRATPEGVLHRSFTRRGNGYVLDPSVRRCVEFRRLNLTDEHDPFWASQARFDLILCRNVLIYLGAEAARAVVERLLGCLAPGGRLALGASDPMFDSLEGGELVMTRHGAAYRLRPSGRETPLPPTRWVGPPPVQDARGLAADDVRRGEPPPPAVLTPEPMEIPKPSADSHPLPEALAAYARGRHREAIDALNAAATGRPGTWLSTAAALADQGDLEGAAHAVGHAIELHPEEAELRVLQALVLAERGHLDAAIEAARAALYLDRRSVRAHGVLGVLLGRAGQHARAKTHRLKGAGLLAQPEGREPQ